MIIQKKIQEGFIGQKIILLPPALKKASAKNDLVKGCFITAIGYYPKANYHYKERPTGSDEFILIYCIEGEGYVVISERTYTIKANCYIVVPRHTPHRYESAEHNPWTIYWIHFNGLNAHLFYERTLSDKKPSVHTVPFDRDRIQLFDQMYALLEHSYHEKKLEVVNMNLIYFISSLIHFKERDTAETANDHISNSVDYMKNNIEKKLTVLQLAQERGISPSHYLKIFKQKTGSTPIHLFNLLKVQASCQYLYFTNKSIKEICTILGFDDPYYFSRIFTKINGIPPSKYRKSNKKD